MFSRLGVYFLGACCFVFANAPSFWVLATEPPTALAAHEGARKLEQILDGLDVEHHWLRETRKQENKDGTTSRITVTHCDAFVKTACDKLGAPLIRGKGWGHANQQADWLRDKGAARGWEEVSPVQAQARANEGHAVVAAFKNEEGGHGHVAMVRPGFKSAARIKAEGPQIAQAGWDNYRSTTTVKGFEHHRGAWKKGQIHFWAYVGEKSVLTNDGN